MRAFAPLALAVTLLAGNVAAEEIILGNNGVDHLMWIKPEGSCTGKVLSPLKVDRCGIPVTLDDGKVYQVNGCGGQLEVVGDNGNTFQGKCYTLKKPVVEKCGTKTHHCPDQWS